MQTNHVSDLPAVHADDAQTDTPLLKSAPIELDASALIHVAGGLGPNGTWAASTSTLGPNGNW